MKLSKRALEAKLYGDEPQFAHGHKLTNIEFINSLNWYNSMKEVKDARNYLASYFSNDPKMIKIINSIPDKFLPLTAAWKARIISNGAIIDDSKNFIKQKLMEAYRSKDQSSFDKPREAIAVARTKEEKADDRLSDIIGEIESFIDMDHDFSMYEYLSDNNIPISVAQQVMEYFIPFWDEMIDGLETKEKKFKPKNDFDEQIKEFFSYISKEDLKEKADYYQIIIDDCEDYINNVKKIKKETRKPRKKKAVSIDKKLQHFKFCQEDKEYRIVSIKPDKILGAQELWVFNVKYQTLIYFKAKDSKGLDIYRTAIVNYDEKTSIAKRVGRKAETVLDTVLNGGKVAARKVFDSVTTEKIQIPERINENCVILRV